MESILQPLVKAWLGKIDLAKKFKKDHFQDDADEAMKFFNGPHDFMYDQSYSKSSKGLRVSASDEDGGFPHPTFKMTVNKAAEMVQLFGPVLYHKNPIRQASPRELPMPPIEFFGNPNDQTPLPPPIDPATGMPLGMSPDMSQAIDPNTGMPLPAVDPMTGMPVPQGPATVGEQVQDNYAKLQEQQDGEKAVKKTVSMLVEHLINYTPNELGLKDQFRSSIDEAIITGASCLWTEVYVTKTGQRLVRTSHDSVYNLVVDCDMDSWEDIQWMARYCVHPVWQVEREYNLKPGSLKKGNLESASSQGSSTGDADADYRRRCGQTNDLLGYWKIWSKMGAGGRMTGMHDSVKGMLEEFGDYCYLVVADTVPWPLNLPEDVPMTEEQFRSALDWPTPFWLDDEWPMTLVQFHPVPRNIWPMSHLKPAMGELKFLNWAYSFLAGKVRTTCRDFVVTLKAAGEELKDRILNGPDLTHLELEQAGGQATINEIIQFLQHPPMQGDIFRVLQLVENNFEKRTGLTELIYGMSTKQMRSAEEASLKADQLAVRPDDMASRVEESATMVARKEAIASRWHLTAPDVQPILGALGAQLWQELIVNQDPSVVLELDYRIEAGSARKPNKDRDVANMSQAMQTLGPILQTWAMNAGDVNPFNAMVTDWAKTLDLDASKYLLTPPPPPPPPAPMPAQQGGQPGPSMPPEAMPPAM